MRPSRTFFVTAFLIALLTAVSAQTPTPPPPQAPGGPRPAGAPPGGPGGGQGRRGMTVMTLTSTAWSDGGMIPVKFSQAGPETSPAFAWSQVPEGTTSSC